MSNRKIMQAPGLPHGPGKSRRPQQRGFWEWLLGVW
jgi:hypothetical protein